MVRPARSLASRRTAAGLLLAACWTLAAGAAARSVGGDPERGRELLSQYQCGACHSIPGVPSAGGTQAPPLGSFGLRSYIAGRVANRPDLLARWIVDPQALVPGTAMPNMGVRPVDARHMAAYLMGLR